MSPIPVYVTTVPDPSDGHSQAVLPYLDMPLPHAILKTLYRMKLPSTRLGARPLKVGAASPHLPSPTFIVEYPVKPKREYQSLVTFVQEIPLTALNVPISRSSRAQPGAAVTQSRLSEA